MSYDRAGKPALVNHMKKLYFSLLSGLLLACHPALAQHNAARNQPPHQAPNSPAIKPPSPFVKPAPIEPIYPRATDNSPPSKSIYVNSGNVQPIYVESTAVKPLVTNNSSR